jgi:hypothetical protein
VTPTAPTAFSLRVVSLLLDAVMQHPPPVILVRAGVDPKSIVCEFFRHGKCQKGFKCKYSHDLSVERKTSKIDIYSDRCAMCNVEEAVCYDLVGAGVWQSCKCPIFASWCLCTVGSGGGSC